MRGQFQKYLETCQHFPKKGAPLAPGDKLSPAESGEGLGGQPPEAK